MSQGQEIPEIAPKNAETETDEEIDVPDEFDGLCPKCGDFYMQYQGAEQMGVSGHWFDVWKCLRCGYYETS